ncbi:hypothetical protein BerOc1_03076 [Pseudodesulfovibrio hydrargyri]|uniref:Uncharacterized protein n=1 Tax=Pseudodesulfovibrio hydrargyri TaxID=2125990 RepID=A0A1J5N688_9BACT|nr:hypothetical protein [Pseudodesulfovibrio hydrargyri]OIQ51131.1 hypothetical protein BerOc1_03076 [Pseudodesulfovibrio hydrargyri]
MNKWEFATTAMRNNPELCIEVLKGATNLGKGIFNAINAIKNEFSSPPPPASIEKTIEQIALPSTDSRYLLNSLRFQFKNLRQGTLTGELDWEYFEEDFFVAKTEDAVGEAQYALYLREDGEVQFEVLWIKDDKPLMAMHVPHGSDSINSEIQDAMKEVFELVQIVVLDDVALPLVTKKDQQTISLLDKIIALTKEKSISWKFKEAAEQTFISQINKTDGSKVIVALIGHSDGFIEARAAHKANGSLKRVFLINDADKIAHKEMQPQIGSLFELAANGTSQTS